MPTYEYECDACGYKFEEVQRMSDKPIKKCPSCGERKVRKLFSAFSPKVVKTMEQVREQIKKQVIKDRAELARGNTDLLYDIAGEKANPLKELTNTGVKYMKDVKGKSAVKRKSK